MSLSHLGDSSSVYQSIPDKWTSQENLGCTYSTSSSLVSILIAELHKEFSLSATYSTSDNFKGYWIPPIV